MSRRRAWGFALLGCACALALAGCSVGRGASTTSGVPTPSVVPSGTERPPESTAVAAAIASVAAQFPEAQSTQPTRTPGRLPPVEAVVVTHGSRLGGKVVALTFDLCATPHHTEKLDTGIVAALKKTHTPATFMMTGLWATAHPKEAALLASVPYFEIGNHSDVHPHPLTLSNAEMRADTLRAQQKVFTATNRIARVYRFPYEESDQRTVGVVAELGLVPIAQDVNPGDPDPKVSAARIAAYVPSHVRPGSIVIMHANGRGWHSAAALPAVISRLKAKGYRFVTVSQLLGIPSDTAPR